MHYEGIKYNNAQSILVVSSSGAGYNLQPRMLPDYALSNEISRFVYDIYNFKIIVKIELQI